MAGDSALIATSTSRRMGYFGSCSNVRSVRETNCAHQIFARERTVGPVHPQDHASLDESISDCAFHDDDGAVQPCLPDQCIRVQAGNRARMPGMDDGLACRVRAGAGGLDVGLALSRGSLVQALEHLADDRAPLVADQMQHARNFQAVRLCTSRANSSMLAMTRTNTSMVENSGTLPDSATVDPRERAEGVDEGRGERAQRMKKRGIAGEPEHQTRGIRDRTELDHDEGHGEHDAGERHHSRSCSREPRLRRCHRQIEVVGREVGLLQPRQRETAGHAPADVEHGNEPKPHLSPSSSISSARPRASCP